MTDDADSVSSAPPEPLSVDATVFSVSMEAVVFEFSLDNGTSPEMQIGYAKPNQIRVGSRLIPSTVRKVETLSRYVDIGDELRVSVTRIDAADLKTFTYAEEGEEGQEPEQVEIQPDWVAVECEKKARAGSPSPAATPPTPASTGRKRTRGESTGGVATPVRTKDVIEKEQVEKEEIAEVENGDKEKGDEENEEKAEEEDVEEEKAEEEDAEEEDAEEEDAEEDNTEEDNAEIEKVEEEIGDNEKAEEEKAEKEKAEEEKAEEEKAEEERAEEDSDKEKKAEEETAPEEKAEEEMEEVHDKEKEEEGAEESAAVEEVLLDEEEEKRAEEPDFVLEVDVPSEDEFAAEAQQVREKPLDAIFVFYFSGTQAFAEVTLFTYSSVLINDFFTVVGSRKQYRYCTLGRRASKRSNIDWMLLHCIASSSGESTDHVSALFRFEACCCIQGLTGRDFHR
jgi:hypothetical protein